MVEVNSFRWRSSGATWRSLAKASTLDVVVAQFLTAAARLCLFLALGEIFLRFAATSAAIFGRIQLLNQLDD
jgi:hypothetical protein